VEGPCVKISSVFMSSIPFHITLRSSFSAFSSSLCQHLHSIRLSFVTADSWLPTLFNSTDDFSSCRAHDPSASLSFSFPFSFYVFFRLIILLLLSCSRATSAAFNLINDIDIPETEKRLAILRQENAAFTALNAQRDARDALSVHAEDERIWREQQERAKEARLEEEEERLEREKEKKEIIDSLVSTIHIPSAPF
jgi:hypothetical protein